MHKLTASLQQAIEDWVEDQCETDAWNEELATHYPEAAASQMASAAIQILEAYKLQEEFLRNGLGLIDKAK